LGSVAKGMEAVKLHKRAVEERRGSGKLKTPPGSIQLSVSGLKNLLLK
jgi:hypothetical protein